MGFTTVVRSLSQLGIGLILVFYVFTRGSAFLGAAINIHDVIILRLLIYHNRTIDTLFLLLAALRDIRLQNPRRLMPPTIEHTLVMRLLRLRRWLVTFIYRIIPTKLLEYTPRREKQKLVTRATLPLLFLDV